MIILWVTSSIVSGQFDSINENNSLIEQLMKTQPENFDFLLKNPEKYRLQIIYTQVDKDQDNSWKLHNFFYRLYPDEYVYLASIMKLPLAALTLEKLHNLDIVGLDIFSSLQLDTTIKCNDKPVYSKFIQHKLKNLDMCIQKALVLSDNDAYNILYDFLEQKNINFRLHDMGYTDVRVMTRFIKCSETENRMSANIKFYYKNKLIYEKPELYNIHDFSSKKSIYVGEKEMIDDNIFDAPKDFKHYNFISLIDAHKMLQSIVYPELFNKSQRFKINTADRDYLLKYMAMYPREMNDNTEEYISKMPDNYMNFILIGNTKKEKRNSLKVYNKSGMSFGFVSDVCYIVDEENDIRFFLSAVIYVNENEIINDDHYEYSEIALPFMVHLGKLIYDYELYKKIKSNK